MNNNEEKTVDWIHLSIYSDIKKMSYIRKRLNIGAIIEVMKNLASDPMNYEIHTDKNPNTV